MLYLWAGIECPNSHIAVYDKEQSPEKYALTDGQRVTLDEFNRCYVCVRSVLDDLNDDDFVRTRLRHEGMYAYIFTAKEMFYIASGSVRRIKLPLSAIFQLKQQLALTDVDIDGEPKLLSDEQLQLIFAVVAYPHFSRTPILTLPIKCAVVEKKYDVLPSNASSPLVNEKVKNLLLTLAPDDVQFINTKIYCKDSILTNYYLLNLTSKIIGIDREKSIYTMMPNIPNMFGSFRYLTYKPGCMGQHKLARDAEDLGNILVTSEIQHAFEKEKIKGVWFIEPEKYHAALFED